MNPPIRSRARRQTGSSLVLAVFTVAVLSVLIGVTLDYTGTTAIASRRGRELTVAQGVANGALEAAYKNWQNYMANNQDGTMSVYSQGTNITPLVTPLIATLNAATVSTGYQLDTDAANPGLKIEPVNRWDAPIGNHFSTTDASGVTTTSGTRGPLSNVPGWTATTFTYKATARVKKINAKPNDGSIAVSVSRYFQQADAPLFQAMLFFQDDLELHPGPAMTLYGLVHTNANMYLAAGSGGSLTFASNVSFHGNPPNFNPASSYKYLDPNGYVEGVTSSLFKQESGNWTNYNAPGYSTSRNDQLSHVQALYPLGTDDSTAIDTNNPNASGTHEIIERPVPVSATNPNMNSSYTDPSAFAAHRVYKSASLRVFINHNKAYTTTLPNGSTVTSQIHVYTRDSVNQDNSVEIAPGQGTVASPNNIANSIANSIAPDSSTGDIYDYREGRPINANTIDMSALTPALNSYASANASYNQVMYVTDVTNADSNGMSGNSDAIRIKKGGTLPDLGLTVATDGAVYVQGDYNTGTTYVSGTDVILKQPVSNTAADPTQFTVNGYTQRPAAVIGDAVMILSNAWNDANTTAGVNSRVATPTTLNAAILSGAVLTTKDAASGGAHNFPRFLENWGGQNFTYHGSMAELYASKLFTGTYGKGNVYSPPNRRWFFDNALLNSPPPGNLRTTTYARGRWARNNNL